MDDYYTVLGVSEDATVEEIHAAYRRLVFKHHPDRNPDNVAEATRATVAINLAYEMLSNERRRNNYDGFRRYTRRPAGDVWDAPQQRAYEEARDRYQESEAEARERVRKWFYDRLSVRPTKRHWCYELQGNGTALDNLVSRINMRLGDKVWEYRITSVPDSGDKVAYRIRVVCDPTKCGFREYHSDWVQGYYYGLFTPGTTEEATHNERIVRMWVGDILDQATCSHRTHVFFGVVGDIRAPWRCYLDLSVVLTISAYDAFFYGSVPGLTRFAKQNRAAVAAVFNELAIVSGICPADLCRSQTMRRDLARRAENILRGKRGMRILREWAASTS